MKGDQSPVGLLTGTFRARSQLARDLGSSSVPPHVALPLHATLPRSRLTVTTASTSAALPVNLFGWLVATVRVAWIHSPSDKHDHKKAFRKAT